MRAALLLLVACSTPSVLEARRLPANVSADAQAVVAANNAFACDLYAQLAPTRPNIFFSPFSISTALAMLDAGAAGNTDAQLRAAMHEDLPTDGMNTAYRAILASLSTGTGYGGYTLQIADRLFGQQGFPFLSSYIATTKDDYGAPLEPVDFNDPSATTTIDQWVSDHTNGQIPQLFAPGTIDPSTVLVTANAIHFQGTWDAPFDPATSGAFHLANGTDVSAALMHKESDKTALLGSVAGTNATIGAIPFQGKDLAMVIVLPEAADGLPAIEAELTPDHLASWLAAPQPTAYGELDIVLPKFAVNDASDLKALLQALGVVDAFDSTRADFSGIDGAHDLSLFGVQHEAVVRVDEHGAEASAATGGTVGITTAPPSFTVDHAFIFMIYDEVTGAVLFMGRVTDPTQN